MRRILIGLVTALFACGGNTDSGSGTGTLFAVIEITGRPNDTQVELELKAGGNAVTQAEVVITDVEREQMQALENKGGGDYRYNFDRYVRTLKIVIKSGSDELEAQLEGPAPHVITRPPNESVVRRADFEELSVEWEADAPADRVEIIPDDPGQKVALEGDPFEAEIPLGPLRNGAQEIAVERETAVDLAGGTAGSRMRSRYKVDNRFTLE